MSVDTLDVFVVIKWPDDIAGPRYSFATLVHAAEIQEPIERVQTCSSMEKAAAIAARLNQQGDVARSA
jgi:hypothetical protein